MRWRPSLSIVVCARNEEGSVFKVLHGLSRVFPDAELILVDNGSTDATVREALRIPGIKVVFEPQAGKGHAIRAGAAAALGQFLLFHDADAEYSVEDAAQVVREAQCLRGLAIGVRVVSFASLRWSSWLANELIRRILQRRFAVAVQDVLSGTRCLPKEAFDALGTRAPGFAIETEMTLRCLQQRLPLAQPSVRYFPRNQASGKKIKARDMVGLLRAALLDIRPR